ncbi:MAG TPA: hypothetical protein VFJ90_12345 [Candidatus Didemnitutus sp.]|nr:hypothetical protein [Candidatus Didemnitutus sp.]
MSLTWHIVLKDFRRLKLGLAIWTIMIIGQIFVAERMFSTAAFAPGWFEKQEITLMLAILVGDVFAFFLSAAIVLEDSLVGTRMFWVTRPISGGRLLAAKSLAVLLAVVLWPLAIALPWWIYCGFGFEQLLQAIRFVLLNQGALAVIAMMLSALSGEGSRFLLWTLMSLIALPLLTTILFNRSEVWVPREVVQSRVALVVAVILLGSLAVIGLQFCMRRVGRSVAVVACAAGLAILVSTTWPWNLVQFWPRDTEQRPGTEGIKIELLSASIFKPTLATSSVVLHFRAKDIPPDLSFWASGRAEATFTWSDGSTFRNSGIIQSQQWLYSLRRLLHLPDERRDPETEERIKAMEASGQKRMRELDGLPRKAPDGVMFSGVIQISPELAERFSADPPVSCTVRLRVTTQQPEVVAEMPWDDGMSRTPDGVRLRQVRMDHPPEALTGKGSGAKARSDGTSAKASMVLLISRPSKLDNLQFFFVNRHDGAESFTSVAGPTTPFPSVVMPVRYDLRWITATPPKVWRTDKWVLLPNWGEWMEAGSLVLVAFKDHGGFDREVSTDHLVMSR